MISGSLISVLVIPSETMATARKNKAGPGGARPGAGRPPLFEERSDLSVRFERRELDKLVELAGERGVSVAELVRDAVTLYLARRRRR
jgi:hypothetical protein